MNIFHYLRAILIKNTIADNAIYLLFRKNILTKNLKL